MSKIRTLEHLSDKLDQELAWRKQELADLKSLLDISPSNTRRRNVLLRSAVTMLYAHWEGFVKEAAVVYLEYVSRQDLRYDQLTMNFITLAFKDQLDKIKVTQKPCAYTEALAFITSRLSEKSKLPYKGVIKTESNLSSSVLKEITCVLGLDYSFYEPKQELIDTKLLRQRNAIAHGEDLTIGIEGYSELHREVINMMNFFKDQVENHACQKSYQVSSS